MKKRIVILLALALLLTGCGQLDAAPVETAAPERALESGTYEVWAGETLDGYLSVTARHLTRYDAAGAELDARDYEWDAESDTYTDETGASFTVTLRRRGLVLEADGSEYLLNAVEALPAAGRPPEEAETPAPETTPEPTAMPKPTETPEPTAPPKPTEEPEPTETPKPTDTPKPTATPEPTEEPEPTETPEPTEEPEPSETPEPTEEPEPTAAPARSGANSPEALAVQVMEATLRADLVGVARFSPVEVWEAEGLTEDALRAELAGTETQMAISIARLIASGLRMDYAVAEVEPLDGAALAALRRSYQRRYGLEVMAAVDVTVEIRVRQPNGERTGESSFRTLRLIALEDGWYLGAEDLYRGAAEG